MLAGMRYQAKRTVHLAVMRGLGQRPLRAGWQMGSTCIGSRAGLASQNSVASTREQDRRTVFFLVIMA